MFDDGCVEALEGSKSVAVDSEPVAIAVAGASAEQPVADGIDVRPMWSL